MRWWQETDLGERKELIDEVTEELSSFLFIY
jgi:hypothetical protein